jgi:hypothetical protein
VGFKIKLLAFIIGLAFTILIVHQIKRTRISPSCSILWLGVAFFLLSVSAFEGFYRWLATTVIGIVDARHIIYIFLIGFLLIYVFYLTSIVMRLNDQIQNLISYISILENRIEGGKEDGVHSTL